MAGAGSHPQRRRLVIVSFHLPISARRDAANGNKWTIEWDPVRSDHMTPNLRMLMKDYDVSWVGWPGSKR